MNLREAEEVKDALQMVLPWCKSYTQKDIIKAAMDIVEREITLKTMNPVLNRTEDK